MKKILQILIFITPILFLLAGQFTPITDMSHDLSEHILIGKVILESHKVISTNLFTYTNTHSPYIDYGWLSEVIFYVITSVLGIYGLFLIKIFLVLVAFLILYIYSIQRYNPLLVASIALAYFFIFLDRTSLRPEIVSYVFIAITLTTLYRFREKQNRFIFALIPLQILWANMHLYFLVGLILQFLFVLEALCIFRKREEGNYLRSLLIVFILSIFSTTVTPYGLMGVLYPFTLFQNYAMPIRENFNIFMAEKLQPNTIIVSIWMYKIVTIILMILPFIKRTKNRLIDMFIIFFFIVFGGAATRNLQVFVLATFIPFCYFASTILENFHIRNKKIYVFATILFFCFAVVSLKFEASIHGFGYHSIIYPENAVNFLVENNILGPIFNDYDMGDYLAYRLYPKELVYIDGRPEAYPSSFFKNEYIPLFL